MACVNYWCAKCGHYQWENLDQCEKCKAELSFVPERDEEP